MKMKKTEEKGITLIALVITIIVLLILAGVTINMVVGQNGIITRANQAKEEERGATVEEIANLWKLEKETVRITGNGSIQSRDELLDNDLGPNGTRKLLTADEVQEVKDTGKVTIGSKVIDFGVEQQKEIISTTESYVGYYADIDGNGTVDGIIYADLAHDKSGIWNNDSWSNYAYTAQTNLKSYYISQINYSKKWSNSTSAETITADVIAPISGTTGNDRFYVMSLDDFKQGTNELFYWYYNAYGKLDRNVATDYNDFGQGKTNTINMINDWNNNTDKYGEQTISTSGKSYIDLWGAIQDNQYSLVQDAKDSGKWFIPSKAEWSAFGDYLYTDLNVTSSNYSNFGLSYYYWSSSEGYIRRVQCELQ